MLLTGNNYSFSPDLKCNLSYSAPLELLFSLNALVAPENHPDCANWAAEKYSSLDEKLKKEIDFFARHYVNWYYTTDLCIHLAEGLSSEECTLERITNDILKMDRCEFALHFLGLTAFNFNVAEINAWQNNLSLITKESLREQAAFLSVDDVVYFFEHLDELRTRLVNTILLYWEESFKFEWPKIEAFGRKAAVKERYILNNTNPIEYVQSLHPDIVIKDNTLIFKKNPDFSIPIDKIKTLEVTLSVFVGSFLGVNIIGDKVCITKGLSFQAAKIEEPIPVELIECLKACSDETRLKMLKIFWHGNATTQELSKVLDLSPSTVSLHLKQLKAAGLVDSYKVNKYVYYFIKPETIKTLSQSLQKYFER